MQNPNYFYDGINSYLYSLVHHSGNRANNLGNYQQPYQNNNYASIQNPYNDYVRQNIGVSQYNNFNPYENRNPNIRENEIPLNNRYYSGQQSITRQQYQNSYYNPNQWRNRYLENNHYVRPQTRRKFQPNRHASSQASKNRQLTRVKPHENTKQIPGNLLMIDNNISQNTVPSNSNNATSMENLANKNTEVDLFQIDTQPDFSNLEKNSLDDAISKSSESTAAETNVVKEIISAFCNVPQENTPLEPIPNTMHKGPQQVLNVMHKESQPTFNVMNKKTQKRKRNKNKKNNKNGSKIYHNVVKSNKIENINRIVPKDVATVICLDSEYENEDDDVIEIPRTPIPMICLEDSDVENDNFVENIDHKTPVKEKSLVPENDIPACLEVKSAIYQNEVGDISMDNIQNISTVAKEVENNPTPTPKNKKRQKRKRECVENIENEFQNENETSVNIHEEVNSQEFQTSTISEVENNIEENTTQIESNLMSKNKKCTKKKRESLKNVDNERQNTADISENIEEEIQKLQASILQKVLSSDQNITATESNPTPKNKKRQKKKRDCLENVESENQNVVETSVNNSEIEYGLNESTTYICRDTGQNISTPLKDVKTNPTPRTKKRPKKKRLRSTDKSMTVQEQHIENKEDTPSITKENCESYEISKIFTVNTTEIPTQNTPIKNIEFATPKSKKRRKAQNKNISKLSDGSDDFLMHATDLESNQSNDSVVTNESIVSAEISKKNITVPKTLIPDIYETESSCSDIFEKDAPEHNQATTSKRPFAELDLIQFADMITTSRSKKNECSYTIAYAKSSQNCNQTTSVSFSADSSHRVIATDSTKFHFADTSSSSDESDVNSKYQTQTQIFKTSSSQNEIKNTLESDLSYQKFLCQEIREKSSSSDKSEIATRIRNNHESDKSENETRISLSHTGDESKSQNTVKNNLVPLNNDDENGTIIDVNYEQFINQLENKIRKHTDSSHDSENYTTLNETQELSISSGNDSDVECITPIAPENPVISIDSDQESIIFINDSEVKDVGDICLNVSGYSEKVFNMEENKNRGAKRKSDSLNISKEEERALNLKMRFHTYWTADRELFYNRSWGGETYDHVEEQGLMSVSLKEWYNPIDKMRVRRSLDSKVRCRNCRQQGHMSKNCPVPIKPCSMCGSRQHREFKCNESCCLTCFSKFRRTFTPNCKRCLNWRNVYCKTCHNKGHIPDYCPDLWRRYHLTVKPGHIIQPKQKNYNNSTNWCSICAAKGHSSDKCRYYYNILYTPPDSMQVKNYSDLYDYNNISPKRRKCNDGDNNHWDIHQMKFSNENRSFLDIVQENSTKNTTINSNTLSARKNADKIDLISSTSTKSTELAGSVSVETESMETQSVTTESNETQPVEIELIATQPVETELIATQPVANVTLEHEPITSKSNIKSNTTLSNETTSNATESSKTLPVSSEPSAVLPENIQSNVTELNKTELQIKSNDAENLVVESVSIELLNETSKISKESIEIINKSEDTERMVSNPIITDSIANTPIVNTPIISESVASVTENDFAAPNNQVIIRTNIYKTVTTELTPDIAIPTDQSMRRISDEKFDLNVPLTLREEECAYREKLITTLTTRYRANVHIRQTNSIKFLHITAEKIHRIEIENCLREFLTVRQTASRSYQKFENLLNKIRNDYPLIEEIYNLEEPYSLYQTFKILLRNKKKGDLEVVKIVKKLNAFRKIRCQKLSQRTRKYLQFLYDIYTGQNIPINLGTRAKQAYNHIFKNTTINELDEIINEFNLKISKQSTPKKLSPTRRQKIKNLKLKPVQKSTVSSTNDMELIKYANILEMAAGNRSKYKKVIKRCKNRYSINKEFSKKNLRSLMAVGEQLKIPFPIT